MPDYQEVGVKWAWPEQRKDTKIAKYFPDYTEKQLPNYVYFWNVNISFYFN